MSIYLNSVPYKGWSLKEKDCFIKTKNKTIYNKRYSLGMYIDTNYNIDFTIKEKALNGNNFNSFMKKINKKNNKIIFLDNPYIHKNILFKNIVDKNKWNIIYNIPYHSHLNPIEYVFSLLRNKIQNKIEKIKKEKITKLENKLTKDKTRLRTSNIYKNFNEYFILKMEIHNEICKLYEDKRLNKMVLIYK